MNGCGFWCRCVWFCLAYPPGRLANRRGLFGGQSGEVFWEAFISFGFLGVCSFAVFPSG